MIFIKKKHVIFSGILLSGGIQVNRTSQGSPLAALSSVEIYVPSSRLSYTCPPLPDIRFAQVQEGSQYCGGLGTGTYFFIDGLFCYKFMSGSWQSSANLTQLTMFATSFDSSAGMVIMGAVPLTEMGAENISTQALLVNKSGEPQVLFNLTAPAL